MVEFALALPIFLLLIFGVIEFGRLLMTYSAVFSAAREGARYGAAVGDSGNGTSTNPIRYDHDCVGMRAAAQRVGFLGGVQATEDSVFINLRKADGTLDTDWCKAGEDNSTKETGLGDMIEVTVAVNYAPIVPLVPIPQLTVDTATQTGGIRATASRTVVQNVDSASMPPPTPTPTLYALTININGSGSVDHTSIYGDKGGSWPTFLMKAGDTVTLSAQGNTTSTFVNWSGDASGTLETASLVMTGPKTVTANFTTGYTLTVNKSGSGNYSISPVRSNNRYSGTVSISAVPAPGHFIAGWTGAVSYTSGGAPATVSINMSSNQTENLFFAPVGGNFTLSVASFGGGSVSPACSPCTYPSGAFVAISASPDAGNMFTGWTGGSNPVENPLYVFMNENRSYTATFAPISYALVVNKTGNGSVVIAPGISPYSPGTVVTLTASPDPGWVFSGWSGAATGTNPSITLTMDSSKSVTATFTDIHYDLNVKVTGGGSVSKNPDKTYYSYSDVVILTASTSGKCLTGWSGDLTGTANPATITITTNMTINAAFSNCP